MYHPTEMANALTPTSWSYSLYLHTPERHDDNDHPSRLEISFLLESGASISVLNYPTYLTMAKLLNITCNDKTNHTSKTLTVANKSEVPILQYISATLNTAIEQTSRQFIIPCAVADIYYNILGTHSLKNIYTTSKFKILHYNSNINQKINRLPLNLLLYFPKTIHVSHTYSELILKQYYQVNDINTLVNNVAHTYLPDITEPIPSSKYITSTQDIPSSSNHFSLHQIYMTSPTIHDKPHSKIYNVQPNSDTSKSRTVPTLPYSKDNLKFINKYNILFSDLTDTEYVTLCNLLVKHKKCYATHKNDVGKIATPFRIQLKPNAQLLTQRPSKVPIHYREKLKNLLKELEKHNIIKQIGSSPEDKHNYGTTYLNPIIIIPKGDSIKCILDARHLNSNTEQSDESWTMEPFAPQLARAN